MGEVQDQGPEQFGCSLSPKDWRLRAKWPAHCGYPAARRITETREITNHGE